MAVEVFLAPNLLSLYGFQTLYCIHIAKAPAPGTEIPSNSQHIRAAQLMASPSAQPPGCSDRVTGITGLDKPICPTAPDICSRNVAFKSQLPGYLLAKWRPKVTTTRMVCSFYLKYRSIVFSTVSVSSGFAFVS